MFGKSRPGCKVQLGDLVPEGAKQTRTHDAAGAVPGVAHHSQRPRRHPQRLDHEVNVRSDDVVLGLARGSGLHPGPGDARL